MTHPTEDENSLRNLEKILQPIQILPGEFIGVANLERIASISHSICRIQSQEYGGVLGTGFLIAPRLVLTNFHVVQAVKYSGTLDEKAAKLEFRFGYKEDDNTTYTGRLFKADISKPLIASSEIRQLDYALLRLAEIPQTIEGIIIEPLPTIKVRELILSEQVAILQHPEGRPMQFASGSVEHVAEDGRRFQYSTNTLPGSSGSPIFDKNWNLVGLHHSGVPIVATKVGNQGIPLLAILAEIQPYLDEAKNEPAITSSSKEEIEENPYGLSELALKIAKWLYDHDPEGMITQSYNTSKILEEVDDDSQEIEDALDELQNDRFVEVKWYSKDFGSVLTKPGLPLAIPTKLNYNIHEDMLLIARVVKEKDRIKGLELQAETGLAIPRLNHAVWCLKYLDYLEVVRTMGLEHFAFLEVSANRLTRKFVKTYEAVVLPKNGD